MTTTIMNRPEATDNCATQPPTTRQHDEKRPKPPRGELLRPAQPEAAPGTKPRSLPADIISQRHAEAIMQDHLPFRQGRLDGLCGIYAIMNAFMRALNDEVPEYFHGRKCFAQMVSQVFVETDTAYFVTSGLIEEVMPIALDAALDYFNFDVLQEFEILMPCEVFPDLSDPLSIGDVEGRRRWLERVSQTAGIGVILNIQSPWLWHWSSLRTLGQEGNVLLFDSYDIRSAPVEYIAPWRVVKRKC